MTVSPKKHRINITLDTDSLEKLEFLTAEFKQPTKSAFIASFVMLLDISDCKMILKQIVKRKKTGF